MESWRTLSRRIVFHHDKFLTVEEHTVELPDGRIIEHWPWVITPDFINVLAVTQSGEFLCFRQTKYAVHGTSLAPVGGYLDPTEDPLTAAQRELLEETGCVAADWVCLGQFVVGGNRGIATAHLYLARDAWPVAEPAADDLEEQVLLAMTRAEIERALSSGDFKVLSWAATVALSLRYLDGMSIEQSVR